MGLFNRSRTEPSDPYAQMPFKSVETFNLDGMELARVRKRKRREWPIKQVLLFVVAVVAFKTFLFLDMGGAAYGAKVAELGTGSGIEKAAGWAMQIDPVTQSVLNLVQHGSLWI